VSEDCAEQLTGVLRVQVNKLLDDLDQVGELVHVDGAGHLRVNVVQRQVILRDGVNVLHEEAKDLLGLRLEINNFQSKKSYSSL
jgi:hypothetical protein